VRRAAELLLGKEGQGVNPADYNEMHALVGLRNLAARACVLEGYWEEAVEHLLKATTAANENAAGAESTLSKVRKQHEEKLAEWRETLPKQEQRLKDLEAQPGLTEDQMRLKGQLKAFLEEHHNAILHSERSLKTIDEILGQLRADQDTYAKSLAEWQGFLAKEKVELQALGSTVKYVEAKIEQVKADDARPRQERLAYGRRMLHLDPGNKDAQRFVHGLLGIQDLEEKKPQPSPKKRKKR
jgi:small-conductance mechanosensitive channel